MIYTHIPPHTHTYTRTHIHTHIHTHLLDERRYVIINRKTKQSKTDTLINM